MIRNTQNILYLIIVILGFSGCSPSQSVTKYIILTNTPSSTPDYLLITPNVTHLPTAISPTDARKELGYMLQTNGNCTLPCFWGIRPDQTSYDELYDIFYRIGGIGSDTLLENGHHRVSARFSFEERSGIFVSLEADVQDEIVQDLKVDFAGLLEPGISTEDWLAYNIDEILSRYGVPDTAELYLDIPYDTLTFGIRLKYENINTSITYWGLTEVNDEYLTSSSAIFCAEKIGIYSVEFHMGKHPFNAGTNGVSILKATGLDEKTFHRLFTENPSACLTLNREAMGWGK